MKQGCLHIFLYACLPFTYTTLKAQGGNVGIGTALPAERLHVVHTADINKNTIYGYASQASSSVDYLNVGVGGFGQGNGVADGFGYGIGVKGIGSVGSYGAIGVYGGLGTSITQNYPVGNYYYALFADAGTPGSKKFAGAFLNGNLGIGTPIPTGRLTIVHNSYPTPSLLIQESENDYTRMEFRNTNLNSFWQINALASQTQANARLEMWNSSNGANTTPLVILGNGNIGINNTSPIEKLDVGGNLKVGGKINFSGPLAPSNNNGVTGQVLQSNGAAAPSWIAPTNSLYTSMNTVFMPDNYFLSLGGPRAKYMPGLVYNSNATSNSKALVSFCTYLSSTPCAFCGSSTFLVSIVVDGPADYNAIAAYPCYYVRVANGSDVSFTGTAVVNLPAGAHNIKIGVALVDGPDSLVFGSYLSYMNVCLMQQ